LELFLFFLSGLSKKFGDWYQKTNKTEDTNKLTLLAFKIITILHNILLATFIKLLNASLGIDRRTSVTRSWIVATSANRAPFMMLFTRGNRKNSTHRTPLIWCLQAPDQGSMVGGLLSVSPPEEHHERRTYCRRTPLIWRPQAPDQGITVNFFRFPRLKSIMKGARFADVAAIQERLTGVLRSIPK
jgi:hypothetical protein